MIRAMKWNLVLTLLTISAFVFGPTRSVSAQQPVKGLHKTVRIGDLAIFYRDAGPKDPPAILLLHAFPATSPIFRNLAPPPPTKSPPRAPCCPRYSHSSV